MTLQLTYSRVAREDLLQIAAAISVDNPRRALTYTQDIRKTCRTLCEFPLMGVARPDLRAGLRTFALWRAVVIAYEVRDSELRILRIFTRGRDYEAILRGVAL